MKSYFKIVKSVLDQLYGDLDGTDEEKVKKVKSALVKLSKSYADLESGGGPEYDDEYVRFAYVFRYTTAHADFISQIVHSSDDLLGIIDSKNLTVTGIGGGPGSDVLGFVKSVAGVKKLKTISFHLLDKQLAWLDTWHNLDQIVSDGFSASKNFAPIDVCDRKSWKTLKQPYKADIVTCTYFLSEIYKNRRKAAPFFKYAFEKMQPGSALIILDNSSEIFRDWADKLVEGHDFKKVKSRNKTKLQVGYEEQKTDLEEYAKLFDYPKLTGNVFYRVYVKK